MDGLQLQFALELSRKRVHPVLVFFFFFQENENKAGHRALFIIIYLQCIQRMAC
jgi:hypothetical protein